MRLDFNVLWVDDQPSRIAAQIRRIATDMQEDGFNFKPKVCHSIQELRAALGDHVFNDQVDLILVDWDLGGQVQGQTAIAEIRDQIRYKDVIFYSGNQDAARLRQLAFDAGLEGIYCASRTEIVDEVVGVFDSLVKKVLDLDHVRGIVLGATSDIDDMVLDCLTHIHNQSDRDAQVALLNESLDLIEEKLVKTVETVKQLRKDGTFGKVLADHHEIFPAYARARVLSRLLEKDAWRAHHGYRKAVTTYMSDVCPKRNRFGHQVLVAAGLVADASDRAKPMTLEETRVLRCLLLDLRGEVRGLLEALRGTDA